MSGSPYILDHTGQPIGPDPAHTPTTKQFVRATSNTGRFRNMGLDSSRYSVFDHSIAAAIITIKLDGAIRPVPFLAALFHEYGETVLGDVPSPFKTRELKAVETQIYANFWTEVSHYLEDVDPEVAVRVSSKRVDTLLLYVEAQKVLGLLESDRARYFRTEEDAPIVKYAETIVDGMILADKDRTTRLFHQFWTALKGRSIRSNAVKSLIRQFVTGVLR